MGFCIRKMIVACFAYLLLIGWCFGATSALDDVGIIVRVPAWGAVKDDYCA